MLAAMTYLAVKYLHALAAIIAIAGFVVRGFWMISGSPKLELSITRVAPHVVDSLLLLSGIAMLVMLSLNPFTQAWLMAKFAGLAAYILLGTIAIKRGRTQEVRVLAFVGALSAFAYIVGAALSKSPASWPAHLS